MMESSLTEIVNGGAPGAEEIPPPLRDTEVQSAVRLPGSKGIAVRVRSTLPRDPVCPFCRKPRAPNGTRFVRFRDRPWLGTPITIEWKRQQYRCVGGCGRASNETHNGFDDRHFLTRRFVGWLMHEGTIRPFADLAKECGMHASLVRKLFSERARQEASNWHSDKIAICSVHLANQDRPAIFDIGERRFLDVYASWEKVADGLSMLMFYSSPPEFIVPKVTSIVVDVAAFSYPDLSADYFDKLFPYAELFVSGVSIAREASRLIIGACEPLLASCATLEKRSLSSALALFSRERRGLGEHAKDRLRRWEYLCPALYEVYDLKEQLITSIRDRSINLDIWNRWKAEAAAMPAVDLRPIISLVDTHWREFLDYQLRSELVFFEAWLEDKTSNLDALGAHSFASSRAAFLRRLGAK